MIDSADLKQSVSAADLSEKFGQWLSDVLGVSYEALSIHQIAGDASPRRYFRVSTPSAAPVVHPERSVLGWGADQDLSTPVLLRDADTLIAVTSPPSENNDAFLAVRKILQKAGLRVPAQLACDLENGFFLMEDFGDVLLASRLDPDNVDALYAQALQELGRLAVMPTADVALPVFDATRVAEELSVFPEWFLRQHLGLADADLPPALWHTLVSHLISVFEDPPRTVVHRDFHSRNIMCLLDGQMGVIDFQDAVLGPVTYDPVSLLKDCYVRWPREDQIRWLESHRQRLRAQGVEVSDDAQQFVRQFDLVGLQRHLRVMGVFARLSLRDHKSSYLNDLPLVLAYVRETLERYCHEPQIGDFSNWFENLVMPNVARQPWYRDSGVSAQ